MRSDDGYMSKMDSKRNYREKPQFNVSPIKPNGVAHLPDFLNLDSEVEMYETDMVVPKRGSIIRPPQLIGDVILEKLGKAFGNLHGRDRNTEVPQTPGDSHFELCTFRESTLVEPLGNFKSTDSTIECARGSNNAGLIDEMVNYAIDEVKVANKSMQTETLDTSSFVKPKILRKHNVRKESSYALEIADNIRMNVSQDIVDHLASTSSHYFEQPRAFDDIHAPGGSSARTMSAECVAALPLQPSPTRAASEHFSPRSLNLNTLDLHRRFTAAHSSAQHGAVSFKRKLPPFYVTQNKDPLDSISHSIKAHEQQLMRRIQCRYPQWKIFVRNLLRDPSTGDNVAVNFLKELECRREERYRIPSLSKNSDLHKEDEHILVELKRALSSDAIGNIMRLTRMQQLRILNHVLASI